MRRHELHLSLAIHDGQIRHCLQAFYKALNLPVTSVSCYEQLSEKINVNKVNLIFADVNALKDPDKIHLPFPINLAPGLKQQMLQYSWPGNVRELQTLLRRAVVRASSDSWTINSLSWRTDPPSKQGGWCKNTYLQLAAQGLSKTIIANHMGISRSTLYRRLHKDNIR